MTQHTKVWRLQGYDPFEESFYPIEGEYTSEKAAEEAASAQLRNIEETQSRDDSGGQLDEQIQDRIFILRPDGTRRRFLPIAPA